MFATLFGRRAEPEFKVVCDPESIVYPVNFDAPDYPYEQAFKEADAYVRKLPMQGVVPISDVLRLQFYSLFKQATMGDISEKDVRQPSILRDWEGYWKVYGWRKCRGMTREKARDAYIDLLDLQIRKHCSFVWGGPASEDRWAAFRDGVRIIQNLPKGGYRLPESLRAHFYALYRQAHVGDLSDFQKTSAALSGKKYKWLRARPSKAGFDQMRYDEWVALKGMSGEEAKRMYCKDMFKNAAMCGYVWAPPGAEDHLEVIGDQTTAKTLKKRADADKDAERIAASTHLSVEETMNAAGVQLSMVERLTMHSFMRKEQAAAAKAAEEASGCKKHGKEAERKRRGTAGSHADPSKGITGASSKAEGWAEATVLEKATAADAKAKGEDILEAQGMDNDPHSLCALCGSFARDIDSDAMAQENVEESGAAVASATDDTTSSASLAAKLGVPAKAREALETPSMKGSPTVKKGPAARRTFQDTASSGQGRSGVKAAIANREKMKAN
ncbi:hypothetical protein JIQ42_07317 [Leishmania sp. Namibia]|uniref:hypothetical protein n=1 Tax=Leishmania sp. Namibia TaxID=2802991 RepID=UPI001B702482|nr:hypothetical protein JIQ42_07317 [Leishmania sp. Namibia]